MINDFYVTLTKAAGSDSVLSSCLAANSAETIFCLKDGDQLPKKQSLLKRLEEYKCIFLVQNIFKWSKYSFPEPSFSPLLLVNMELLKAHGQIDGAKTIFG